MLLDYSADINAKSTLGGNTALHRAAENGNPGAIRTLLHRGIDYNAKNFFGNTVRVRWWWWWWWWHKVKCSVCFPNPPSSILDPRTS